MQRPACKRVQAVWNAVVAGFLHGEETNTHPDLVEWFSSYNGRGKGAVQLDCFPEPYLGDILGQPMACVLALNPGPANPGFQSRTGKFAKQIRKEFGSYSEWAKSWPYLKEAGKDKPWGHNSHHAARMRFLRRWFRDDSLPNSARIDFELFPWHSQGVTSRLRPPECTVDEFIWKPLNELRPEFVFAFGAPWFRLLESLRGVKVETRIGEGGEPFRTSTRKPGSRTAVIKAKTPWGGRLIVEKHSAGAGPPSEEETERIRAALGFK
jgi:hypothetical protein